MINHHIWGTNVIGDLFRDYVDYYYMRYYKNDMIMASETFSGVFFLRHAMTFI